MIDILEYLKRRQKQDYIIEFPKDLNGVDAIIGWLENNGFERTDVSKNVFDVGKPCYVVGLMDRNNPNTHWIEISDGKQTVILIRTVDNFDSRYKKIRVADNKSILKELSVGELKQYLEKILNSK